MLNRSSDRHSDHKPTRAPFGGRDRKAHKLRGLYRNRHWVENAFARLKHYRAVASRFDKLKRNYESVVAMACAFLWLPM